MEKLGGFLNRNRNFIEYNVIYPFDKKWSLKIVMFTTCKTILMQTTNIYIVNYG